MKLLFGKFGTNAYKFRELFAMIPSSDKYVSILTGSLSAIIKVSLQSLESFWASNDLVGNRES